MLEQRVYLRNPFAGWRLPKQDSPCTIVVGALSSLCIYINVYIPSHVLVEKVLIVHVFLFLLYKFIEENLNELSVTYIEYRINVCER